MLDLEGGALGIAYWVHRAAARRRPVEHRAWNAGRESRLGEHAEGWREEKLE
jgi:hypothetical protein